MQDNLQSHSRFIQGQIIGDLFHTHIFIFPEKGLLLDAHISCSTHGFIKNIHHKNNLALESQLALQDHDSAKTIGKSKLSNSQAQP